MTKRAVVLLLSLLMVSALFAVCAQAQTTSFTLGQSGACNAPYYYQTTHTQYCYADPLYLNGVQTGYFSIYALLDNTTGNLAPGSQVWIQNLSGATVVTSTNLAGTPTSFTFTTPNGSASVTYGTAVGHCYKGHCETVTVIKSGLGSYTP